MNKSKKLDSMDAGNKSVRRTLAILSTFDSGSPLQRTSDVAEKMGMNMSTVSRHLNTMLDMGFLKRDDETGCYMLGMEIIALAGAALQRNDVYRHSFPELRELSNELDIHCHMGMAQETELIHLISISGHNSRELLIPMGHSNPMYCSAMGRVIMAYMDDRDVDLLLKRSSLEKLTPETKTDIKEIKQELVRIRRSGYCAVLGELAEGKASVAAPVFDRNRKPAAAISASASMARINDPEQRSRIARAVMKSAGRISAKLGYYPL